MPGTSPSYGGPCGSAPADGAIVRRLVRPGDGVSTLNVTPLFWFAPGTNAIVRAEADETVARLMETALVLEGLSADASLENGRLTARRCFAQHPPTCGDLRPRRPRTALPGAVG